jgi:DNA-binding NtrC family response regulator
LIEREPMHPGKDSAAPKILLAEDLSGLRRLSPILAGLKVSYVQTLTYAKSKLDDGSFDLIVTGVHFDDSSAVDLLKAVRKHEKHKETPFVFIRTRSSSIAKMIQENIAVLHKVYEFDDLIETENLNEDDNLVREAILACVKRDKNPILG